MRILTHGKHAFAVGLFWQLVDSAHVVRETAESLKMDAYALIVPPHATRRGKKEGETIFNTRPQAGFGLSRELIRVRQPLSLAALLVLRDRGLTQLVSYPIAGNLYWHVAIRDGIILPEGDHVCDAGACEALVAQQHDTFGAGVQHRYATPAELESLLSGIDLERRVGDRRAGDRRAARVTVLVPRGARLLRFALAGLAVTLVVTGGIVSLTAYEHAGEPARASFEAMRQRMEALGAQRRREQQLAQTAARARPWRSLPAPAAFAGICRRELRSTPYVVMGWRLSLFVCSTRGARVGDETLYHHHGSVPHAGFPTGYTMISARILDGPAKSVAATLRQAPARVLLTSDRAWRLYDGARPFGWAFRFTSGRPTMQYYAIGKHKFPYPWKRWGFEISGTGFPFTLAKTLQQFPGVRIQRLGAVFDHRGSPSWTIQGEVYVH